MIGWDRRFLSSTRGRVVSLLRRASHTAEELAQKLGLTDNAVRAHLATLERDGLVRQTGLRRGVSKPSFDYALTPEAEDLFPKAYGPVLRELLDVLSERVPPAVREDILREAGHRLAAAHIAPQESPRARLERALALLTELGGLVELEERDGTPSIRGYNCPLAAAVPGHPDVCGLVETLLADVVGAPVRECCDRDGAPRCAFELAVPATAGTVDTQ
jgi:predicted ArsR family transcriptional regulator